MREIYRCTTCKHSKRPELSGFGSADVIFATEDREPRCPSVEDPGWIIFKNHAKSVLGFVYSPHAFVYIDAPFKSALCPEHIALVVGVFRVITVA